jgi:hypothetical protein
MQVLTDFTATQWINDSVEKSSRVTGAVPRGYSSYARILHSAHASSEADRTGKEIRWEDVAREAGAAVHAGVQWREIAGRSDAMVRLRNGLLVNPPEQGRLNRLEFAAVASALGPHTRSQWVTAGFWSGWEPLWVGESALSADIHRALASKTTMELNGEQYVLIRMQTGSLATPAMLDRAEFGWPSGNGVTPNILWPDDRKWFLSTEIDFDSTLVGGNANLIDQITSQQDLEAFRISAEADLAQAPVDESL